MGKRLIDKAMAKGAVAPRKKRSKFPDDQLVDLAVAWLNNKIGTTQVCTSLGRKPASASGAINTVMAALRRAVASGKRVIR